MATNIKMLTSIMKTSVNISSLMLRQLTVDGNQWLDTQPAQKVATQIVNCVKYYSTKLMSNIKFIFLF